MQATADAKYVFGKNLNHKFPEAVARVDGLDPLELSVRAARLHEVEDLAPDVPGVAERSAATHHRAQDPPRVGELDPEGAGEAAAVLSHEVEHRGTIAEFRGTRLVRADTLGNPRHPLSFLCVRAGDALGSRGVGPGTRAARSRASGGIR